jgi:hypothetical protein
VAANSVLLMIAGLIVVLSTIAFTAIFIAKIFFHSIYVVFKAVVIRFQRHQESLAGYYYAFF